MNLRKEWFAFVKKIRKRVTRKEKREVTHLEAMKIASGEWAPVKQRLIRKNERELKKLKLKKGKEDQVNEKKSE